MSQWVPSKAADRRVAFGNFSAELARRPQAYGVSPADAAEAVRLVAEMDEAWDVASNPATRTPITITAKTEKMEAAEKFLRVLAAFIRHNPSVSAEDLALIGLPPKAEKRRVPPPTTAPMLAIRRIIPGGHEIELRDSTAPDRLGKAADVRGLELFVAYSPSHGEPLSGEAILSKGKLHTVLKRKLSAVIHDNLRVGSVANYIGRWVNNRGEAGPFSQPIRMVVAMPSEARLSEAA